MIVASGSLNNRAEYIPCIYNLEVGYMTNKKKVDLFLMTNVALPDVKNVKPILGFRHVFQIARLDELVVCSGLGRHSENLTITHDHRDNVATDLAQDEKLKEKGKVASILINRVEKTDSNFGVIKVANVNFDQEFTAGEAVIVLKKLLHFIRGKSGRTEKDKVIVALNMESAMTPEGVADMEEFVKEQEEHFIFLSDEGEFYKNGVLLTKDLNTIRISQGRCSLLTEAMKKDIEDKKAIVAPDYLHYFQFDFPQRPKFQLPPIEKPRWSSTKTNGNKEKKKDIAK